MPHYEVHLRRDWIPRFPPRCVWCGDDDPDRTVRLTTHGVGWHTLLLMWGRLVHVQAPVHDECLWRLRTDRWLRAGGQLGSLVIGALLWKPMVQVVGLEDPQKWMLAVWLIGWLVPPSLLSAWRSPPFDFTALETRVEYEFTDQRVADGFARENLAGRVSKDG